MYSATMACTALARPAALALPRPTRILAKRSICTPDPALAAFARQMESGLSLGRRLDASAPAHNLRTQGYAVVDGLLGDAACRRMRTEAEALHAAGSYSQSYSEVAETGEKIWRPGVYAMELNGQSWRVAPTLVIYVSELMRNLARVAPAEWAINDRVLGHKLAVSEGDGAKYPRHLDNVLGAPHDLRKLTAIYYLNPDWAASHEGAIRLFHGAAGPPTAVPAGGTDGAGLHAQQPDSLYTDLFPCGDRLLLFASDVLVHEVLPSYHAHRHTLTIWLTTDDTTTLHNPFEPLAKIREAHLPSVLT